MKRKSDIIPLIKTEEVKVNGRPSKYNDHVLIEATNYAKLGATNEQIADYLGIQRSTFQYWLVNYPELKKAISEAKDLFDNEIVKSLAHNALGYSHKDTQFFQYRGGIVKQEYIKHYPPNVTAQIFWLKNRKRGEWTDESTIKHAGMIGIRAIQDIPLNELNQDEQEIVFKINMKQLEETKKNN